MAKDKNSFVLYLDQKTIFEQLSLEDRGKLITLIFQYCNDENPEVENPLINMAFTLIKNQLKRDLKKYEEKRKQWSEAGKKSAEKRKQQRQQTLTNVESRSTDSTVNVNVNVTDNAILLKKETKFNFKKSLLDYGFDLELVKDWLEVRKIKKARNTETALKGFIREVNLTGLDKNEVLRQCVERSWSGLKAEWINKNLDNGTTTKKQRGISDADIEEFINS